MSTEPISPEVVEPERQEMLAVVEQNALQANTAQGLQDAFTPLFRQARDVLAKARDIKVTDASQTLNIKLARALRLELRSIRIDSDKKRKELKDESLRMGRAIDGFHAILLALVSDEEKRLEEQEKFVERQEAERKAKLKADREAALKPYGLDTSFYALGDMTDEAFAQLLENTQAADAAKRERERKEEEDRIRQENERLKEERRIREENARLKREHEERLRKEEEERAERARLNKDRLEVIGSFIETGDADPIFYGSMSNQEWDAAMERARQRKADRMRREEEERKREAELAEQRRLAEEERRRAEAERQRIEKENQERLEAERKAAQERQRQLEETARKEREERERLEREKRQREADAQRQREEEERKQEAAAAAPDVDKLKAYMAEVGGVEIPKFTSRKGKLAGLAIAEQMASLQEVLRGHVATLEATAKK